MITAFMHIIVYEFTILTAFPARINSLPHMFWVFWERGVSERGGEAVP